MTTLIRPPAPLPAPRDVQSSPRPEARAHQQRPPRGRSTIIVASDGSSGSDGAIRMAFSKFKPMDALLEVVTVVAGGHGEGAVEMMLAQDDDSARRRHQRDAVEAQLARISGEPGGHSVTVLDGSAARTIASVAIERHADFVIVGLGRHDLTDRLFGSETAVQLARISRVPVLAVREDAIAGATHAIVAVDFTEIAERAAQAAVDMVGDGGIVELVHVTPYVAEYPSSVQGQEPYKSWARGQFDALIGRLRGAPGVSLRRAVVRGRAAHVLLERASRVGADLIAAGTHGRGYVARAVLGSVTSDLLRGAHCAVLLVPREPLPARTEAEHAPAAAPAPPATPG